MREFDQSLPMLLLRAREATMGHFRPILGAHGLTEQQWRVLRVLREQGGIEPKELARRTLLLQPSLSGVLDRLERDGLVQRRRSRADGRRFQLSLTRRARRLYDRLGPELENEYTKMQSRFSERRWADLYASLENLIRQNGDPEVIAPATKEG